MYVDILVFVFVYVYVCVSMCECLKAVTCMPSEAGLPALRGLLAQFPETLRERHLLMD